MHYTYYNWQFIQQVRKSTCSNTAECNYAKHVESFCQKKFPVLPFDSVFSLSYKMSSSFCHTLKSRKRPERLKNISSWKTVNSAMLTPPTFVQEWLFVTCCSPSSATTNTIMPSLAPVPHCSIMHNKKSPDNICICNLNADNSYLDCEIEKKLSKKKTQEQSKGTRRKVWFFGERLRATKVIKFWRVFCFGHIAIFRINFHLLSFKNLHSVQSTERVFGISCFLFRNSVKFCDKKDWER